MTRNTSQDDEACLDKQKNMYSLCPHCVMKKYAQKWANFKIHGYFCTNYGIY